MIRIRFNIQQQIVTMRALFIFLLTLFSLLNTDLFCQKLKNQSREDPEKNPIWNSLAAGNRKFAQNRDFAKIREKFINGQNPPCIILSCSDSRVPPEIIFNQNIGSLFTVRTAGCVVDDVVVDTIEYALKHFDVSVIVVLGHSDCGAVKGAIKHLKQNQNKIDTPHGYLYAVLNPIETAILESKIDLFAQDALEKATRANIFYIASQLKKRSTIVQEGIRNGKIKIIGAEYHLKTGLVHHLFVSQSEEEQKLMQTGLF